MKRRMGVAVLLVLPAITPARAGIGAGNGEFGFDFGYTQYDDDFPGGSAARLALRGGYHLTSLFQIEGQYGASHDLDTGDAASSGSQLSTAMLNGVFNFHPGAGNVVPYALIGAGYADFLSDIPDGDDAGFAWQAGVGSRFFFGEHDQVALRVEIARLSGDFAGISTSHDNAVLGFTWRLGAGH